MTNDILVGDIVEVEAIFAHGGCDCDNDLCDGCTCDDCFSEGESDTFCICEDR